MLFHSRKDVKKTQLKIEGRAISAMSLASAGRVR
jgi:hypothetical protein